MSTVTKSQLAPIIAIPGSENSDFPRYARLIQFWTDEEILRPVGEAHGGRGKHRHYDLVEARLAIIASYLNRAGFSTDAIFQAILTIRARHMQVRVSPLDLAVDSTFPFDVEPVDIWLIYWPDIDTFQVAFEEHQLRVTSNPLAIEMRLPLHSWFAGLRKDYSQHFANRHQTDRPEDIKTNDT